MAWLEALLSNLMGIGETDVGPMLTSASTFLLVFGAIFVFSYLLPIKAFSRGRLIIGAICVVIGLALMLYMGSVYDPNFFGKDGPAD